MQLEYLKFILRDMEVTVINKIVLSIFSKKQKDILHKTCIILYKTYKTKQAEFVSAEKKIQKCRFFLVLSFFYQ